MHFSLCSLLSLERRLPGFYSSASNRFCFSSFPSKRILFRQENNKSCKYQLTTQRIKNNALIETSTKCIPQAIKIKLNLILPIRNPNLTSQMRNMVNLVKYLIFFVFYSVFSVAKQGGGERKRRSLRGGEMPHLKHSNNRSTSSIASRPSSLLTLKRRRAGSLFRF